MNFDLTNMDFNLVKEIEALYKFFEEELEKYKDIITLIKEEDSVICIKALNLNPNFFFKITYVYHNEAKTNVHCTIRTMPNTDGKLEEYVVNKWMKNLKYVWEP